MMNEHDEWVIYEGPGSQWTNFGRFLKYTVLGVAGLIVCGLAGLGDEPPKMEVAHRWIGRSFILLAVLLSIRAWWRVRFLTYRVTNHRIEIERGCVSKRVDNVDLYRIVDIQLRVGVAERLVGLGSIVIHTTDKTTPTLVIAGVPKARQLYESLKLEAVRTDKRRGVIHLET